jgi:hypothetical protein
MLCGGRMCSIEFDPGEFKARPTLRDQLQFCPNSAANLQETTRRRQDPLVKHNLSQYGRLVPQTLFFCGPKSMDVIGCRCDR